MTHTTLRERMELKAARAHLVRVWIECSVLGGAVFWVLDNLSFDSFVTQEQQCHHEHRS